MEISRTLLPLPGRRAFVPSRSSADIGEWSNSFIGFWNNDHGALKYVR